MRRVRLTPSRKMWMSINLHESVDIDLLEFISVMGINYWRNLPEGMVND